MKIKVEEYPKSNEFRVMVLSKGVWRQIAPARSREHGKQIMELVEEVIKEAFEENNPP